MAAEACSEIKISVENEEEKKMIDMIERGQWLRAAILGANDGLLSTTSLMLGVGAAKEDKWLMIISGLAGAVAGACSMAVGEFVSVSTQRDIELQATNDQSSETKTSQGHFAVPLSMASTSSGIPHVKTTGDNEPSPCKISQATSGRQPLSHFLSPLRSPLMKVIARDTLQQPSTTLDAVRQESNREGVLPNPNKAAGASGLAFMCGSLVPLLSAMAVAQNQNKFRVVAIVVASSIALAIFGGAGARLGGSPVRVSVLRVVVGGWISMAITYGLLKPFDRDDIS